MRRGCGRCPRHVPQHGSGALPAPSARWTSRAMVTAASPLRSRQASTCACKAAATGAARLRSMAMRASSWRKRIAVGVGLQQTRGQPAGEVVLCRRRDRVDDVHLDAGRHDRGKLEQGAHGGRLAHRAQQHGVAHRRRQALGAQGFGDEERVAARGRVEAVAGTLRAPRQLRDRALRERRQRHPRALPISARAMGLAPMPLPGRPVPGFPCRRAPRPPLNM